MTSPMTLLQAAQHILTLADSPLHTKELTRRMLEGGFWTTQGQTPSYSVYSALHLSIKRHGLASPFVQTAPSTFALRDTLTAAPAHPESALIDEQPVGTHTFLDTAEAVLAALPAGQPMRIRDLIDTARRAGLPVTLGLNPAATMSAQIDQHIERCLKLGLTPRFDLLENGFVGLREREEYRPSAWPIRPIVFEELPQHLKIMKVQRLGRLIEQLLAVLGYVPVEDTQVDEHSIDLRVEATASLVPERLLVRVKKRRFDLHRADMQALRDRLAPHERGLLISLGSFTQDEQAEAGRPDAAPIGLVPLEALVELLIEHRVGVREENWDLLLDLSEADPAPIVDPFYEHLSPIVRDRIAAGLCVSAIDSDGGDTNIWDLDDAVELELGRQHMKELFLRAELAELEERQAAGSPEQSEPVTSPTMTVDVLMIDAALEHYNAVRQEERLAHPAFEGEAGPPGQTLWRMAQLTWPFQVMPGERCPWQTRRDDTDVGYTVYFVRGQGMEEEIWTLMGDQSERDAIVLSVLLRNLYAAGNRDALAQGKVDGFLRYALPQVKAVNATGQTLTPEED